MVKNQDSECKYFFDNDYWVIMYDLTKKYRHEPFLVLTHFVKQHYTLFYIRNTKDENEFLKINSKSIDELLLKLNIYYPSFNEPIYRFKHRILADGTHTMVHNHILEQLVLLQGEHDDKAKIL